MKKEVTCQSAMGIEASLRKHLNIWLSRIQFVNYDQITENLNRPKQTHRTFRPTGKYESSKLQKAPTRFFAERNLYSCE